MVKINLKTLAYNTIKQKIITCKYAPGTFLNEEILTDKLKISRTPIRDTLNRLEQEGLIEIKPKKGITVTALSIRDVNMIFEVRKLYKPYILKNYGSFLDEDKLNEFHHIFSHENTNSECFQNNNYFYDLDFSFHQMIMDACSNIYLRQNHALTQIQSECFRFMTDNISNNHLEDTFREHIDIITPCLQKDWDTVIEKPLHHLDESKRSAFELVLDSIDSSNIGFWSGLDANEVEGHLSVSRMEAGGADTGCGAGVTKAAEIGSKQDSGDPARALDIARNPGTELRRGYA